MLRVGVVGCGASGLTAAVSLAWRGFEVYVVCPGVEESNSYRAQAGVALPLLDGDSAWLHVMDTLRAGRGLCDEEVVWGVVSRASEAFDFLQRLGVAFDGAELEGGHSFPRVFTARNETGRVIVERLLAEAGEVGVHFVRGAASSLAVSGGRCHGVFVGGELPRFDATVLATGGYTGLYKYSSGSPLNTGVLLGDAVSKGAVACDLEFTQFHPTAYISPRGRVVLVSEAVRGAGARLVNDEGERFVDELEARDVVARAVYEQLSRGRRVYLDATRVKGFRERFPRIHEALRGEGVDPEREPVPVAPVAHYSIGGLRVDPYYRTSIRGLYAVGEAACTGFHGANRLASNSLLECIVSGLEVARTIARDKPESSGREVAAAEDTSQDPGDVDSIREILWTHAGVARTGEGLRAGLRKLEAVEADERLKLLARGILECALARRESRGVHYRLDHPHPRKEYQRHSMFNGSCIL
ncbi:L-aspartate oxidase [Stetteria hydrogenophila]